MKEFDSPRGLQQTFPLFPKQRHPILGMFDVLHQANHKVSNLLFVILNICAILIGLLSLVVTTIWFMGTDPIPNMEFIRGIIGLGLFLGYFIVALFCAALAQFLRYLSSIAETQARNFKSPAA